VPHTPGWPASQVNAASDAVSFAVRSSATAEDLPDASFAGQQETYLNIRGIDAILEAIKNVFASLYNDRAIAYRVHHRFEHDAVGISAGVQRMVRSDIGASGVMFTIDTEPGFPDAVFITSSYGLGEAVVQGAVNPDEFYVYKPALRAGRPAILKRGIGSKATKMIYTVQTEVGWTTEFVDVDEADRQRLSLADAEVIDLSQQALIIEEHYGRPMDIEWGKDGLDGQLYILQAPPETVKSRQAGDRLMRGGRHRICVRGVARVRHRRVRAAKHARYRRQDHDEPRNPRPGVRILTVAECRSRAGAAGVHHQQSDRHPPQGIAGVGPAGRAAQKPNQRRRCRVPDTP
jgi:pyruvate,water dikinase